jgi:hypothetical protein
MLVRMVPKLAILFIDDPRKSAILNYATRHIRKENTSVDDLTPVS